MPVAPAGLGPRGDPRLPVLPVQPRWGGAPHVANGNCAPAAPLWWSGDQTLTHNGKLGSGAAPALHDSEAESGAAPACTTPHGREMPAHLGAFRRLRATCKPTHCPLEPARGAPAFKTRQGGMARSLVAALGSLEALSATRCVRAITGAPPWRGAPAGSGCKPCPGNNSVPLSLQAWCAPCCCPGPAKSARGASGHPEAV